MHRRIILAVPFALAACGSVLPQQKYVARIDWPLQPQPPAQRPANPDGAILLVRDLTAGPGLDDQGLHSLLANGSLDISYYNRWAVPPADAATAALASWALASGAFAAVISPGSRLTAGLIVEGELTEFVSDIAAGQARCVLTLVVIANADSLSAKSRPLAQQRITGTAPIAGTSAAAQAAAGQSALANALAQAMALLARFSVTA